MTASQPVCAAFEFKLDEPTTPAPGAGGVDLGSLSFDLGNGGAIATERNAAALQDAAYRSRVEAQIPARRVGVPEDCVGACLLLCSEAGSYITGTTVFVDGGWHRS